MQKYLKIALVLLVPIILYLISFGILAYDSDYYSRLTSKYSAIDAAGMNKGMTDYFKTGEAPESFSAFSEKELAHLEDVKTVINRMILLLMTCTVFFIILINFAEKKQEIIFYGGIFAMAIPLLFLLPFDLLFTQMHSLFFAEGSWIFGADELIVNIYTIDFFHSFAKSIILTGFCLGAVITFLAVISGRK